MKVIFHMREPLDNGASSYRRFLEGDENAANEIMNELFYKLVYFVDGYLKDVPAAEDVAMDVMSDLFVYRHRYNFKVSLKTYVFMRGRSKALDILRRRKKLVMTGLEEAEDASGEYDELESRVLVGERKRAVRAALGKLPDQMREAVHLVYFEELSYEEAARVMGIKPKQVDNLLYRAKKELRSALGEEGKDLL